MELCLQGQKTNNCRWSRETPARRGPKNKAKQEQHNYSSDLRSILKCHWLRWRQMMQTATSSHRNQGQCPFVGECDNENKPDDELFSRGRAVSPKAVRQTGTFWITRTLNFPYFVIVWAPFLDFRASLSALSGPWKKSHSALSETDEDVRSRELSNPKKRKDKKEGKKRGTNSRQSEGKDVTSRSEKRKKERAPRTREKIRKRGGTN